MPERHRTSLAESLRPATWAEITGQPVAVVLARSIVRSDWRTAASGTISACLHGPRGTGKTTIARLLAKELHPKGSPIEIDGGQLTTAEGMRTLIADARARADATGACAVIADEAHRLSTDGVGLWLRTRRHLRGTAWLWATTEPGELPDELLDAGYAIATQPLTGNTIRDRIVNIAETRGIAISPDAAGRLAGASAGSMRDGLMLLDVWLRLREAHPDDGASDLAIANRVTLTWTERTTKRAMRATLDGDAERAKRLWGESSGAHDDPGSAWRRWRIAWQRLSGAASGESRERRRRISHAHRRAVARDEGHQGRRGSRRANSACARALAAAEVMATAATMHRTTNEASPTVKPTFTRPADWGDTTELDEGLSEAIRAERLAEIAGIIASLPTPEESIIARVRNELRHDAPTPPGSRMAWAELVKLRTSNGPPVPWDHGERPVHDPKGTRR